MNALLWPFVAAACSAQADTAAKFESQPPAPASGGAGSGNPMNYLPPAGGSSSGGAPTTGPASGGGGDGAGGVTVVAPPISEYDARVTFDWPESVGDGGAAKCQAGHYAGTFTCNFTPSLADGGAPPGMPATPFPVTGPIELVLTESQNGEFLEVSGGTMTGSTFIAITFTAKISGKLDCQTSQFDGMVSDGSYGIQPFPPGGSFAGPTKATYSSTGPALVNGTWLFTVKDPQGASYGSCPGTWTATYAP